MSANLVPLLLRPNPPPSWLGLVVAAGCVAAETLVLYVLMKDTPSAATGVIYLCGVLVVSMVWRPWISILTAVVSALAFSFVLVPPFWTIGFTPARDLPTVVVFIAVALATNRLADLARSRAAEAAHRRREAAVAAQLARAHVAWRRVATLVARGASLTDVFGAMTEELRRTLGHVRTVLMRYEPDGSATCLEGLSKVDGSTSVPLVEDSVVGKVQRTRRPARIDSYDEDPGPVAATARRLGICSAVGVPVMVQGRMWGVLSVVSFTTEGIPPAAERRLEDFSDLIAIAIANLEHRAQLAASRARIVTAEDNARRQFERDLHDGALQRVVSLGLELSMTEASMPPELTTYKAQLAHTAKGLNDVFKTLQEISRGIHPAIMSMGGLGASIKSLARRSAVPVDLRLDIDRRLPDHAEVAVYHIVSEALDNTAKHAEASMVQICAETENAVFRLSIQDDGVGGASLGDGSGLIGLQDRVAAIGGHMEVVSPAGHGTALLVKIPIDEGVAAG